MRGRFREGPCAAGAALLIGALVGAGCATGKPAARPEALARAVSQPSLIRTDSVALVEPGTAGLTAVVDQAIDGARRNLAGHGLLCLIVRRRGAGYEVRVTGEYTNQQPFLAYRRGSWAPPIGTFMHRSRRVFVFGEDGRLLVQDLGQAASFEYLQKIKLPYVTSLTPDNYEPLVEYYELAPDGRVTFLMDAMDGDLFR